MSMGKKLDDMTPLARLLLRAMRAGAIVCAICLVFFLAIQIWSNWLAGTSRILVFHDYAFFAVMAVLLVMCLWLARAIGREIDR